MATELKRPSGTVDVWVDLASPSHPFFFKSLVDSMPNLEPKTTVRRKTETVDLAEGVGFDFDVLGRDFDNAFLRKLGIALRSGQLAIQSPRADVSLSSRNLMCVLASKARGIPSIHFTDNDITAYEGDHHVEKLYNFFEAQATYNVVPAAFKTEVLERWTRNPHSIHTYEGFKEDVYVASFEPDDSFSERLPFEDYIVIRPEALDAAYVKEESSLVPELLKHFTERGKNIVYLPRYRGDEQFARHYSSERVYTPAKALDGLQLAWHSHGVLTGSGTMAREAACMGKPAVSFFPGTRLSVSQRMIEKDMVFHSRDPGEIYEHLESFRPREVTGNLQRSTRVRDRVVDLVDGLIAESVANA